ncbi:MAG: glucokinase [Gracilibacteraceae bacterium]|nr:glucokinase [Gracilibacteraceae bacterium]
MALLLTGDMGATKTVLALWPAEGAAPQGGQPLFRQKYDSRGITSFEDSVLRFLQEAKAMETNIPAACFCLAGTIVSGRCTLPNLNLTLDLDSIEQKLSFIPRISFVNDLEALGHGLNWLKPKDLLLLKPGKLSSYEDTRGLTKAILAPGTGLGQAAVLAGGQICPSEGQHGDFAPQSERQWRLWQFLHRKFGHVSWERALSGAGLQNLYEFLQAEKAGAPNFTLTEPLPTPAEITARASEDPHSLSAEALDLFTALLGAEAGNMALRYLAFGGVYLAGGIPPRIIAQMKEDLFLESFTDKGRLSFYLESIPVYVVLEEDTPLFGAATLARKISA